MSKFNIGDKVRITESSRWFTEGEIGVIQSVCDIDEDAYVKFDKVRLGHDCWHVNFSKMEPHSVGPIRTVTRREIVNGTYGRLYIERSNTSKRVGVDITGDDEKLSYLGEIAYLDATELREAAHVLNQLAEALEDA